MHCMDGTSSGDQDGGMGKRKPGRKAAYLEDNGILSRIPGEHIAAALKTLPDAETATIKEMQTTLHVPGTGLVTFTCKRFVHTHGKSRYTFWLAKRAETTGG